MDSRKSTEIPKRIFISFSHDSAQHEQRVLELSNSLRIEGFDAELDLYYSECPPPQGWPLWMESSLRKSDYIIVICTHRYLERSENDSASLGVTGVRWETLLTIQQLYNTNGLNRNVIPVVFSESDLAYIPVPLQSTTFYNPNTQDGFAKLLKRLRGVPQNPKPPLGYGKYLQTDQSSPENRGASAMRSSTIPPAEELSLYDDREAPEVFNTASPRDAQGGTLSPESPFYIERRADQDALAELRSRAPTTLTIKGPRQVGKSSLLARLLSQTPETRDAAVAYMDLEGEFDAEDLLNPAAFYQRFCSTLSLALGLEDDTQQPTVWRRNLSNIKNCSNYVLNRVVRKMPGRLLLAIDQADRLFTTNFYSEFFGMVRFWHNQRAFNQLWRRLDIVLITSSEPQLFITNPLQSPFNVGCTIQLSDFGLQQVVRLNRLHGTPLTQEGVKELHHLVHGHPYLTRHALYTASLGPSRVSDVLTPDLRQPNIYSSHLERMWKMISNFPELRKGLAAVINDDPSPDPSIVIRLLAAGLIRQDGVLPVSRCELYSKYFRGVLHD